MYIFSSKSSPRTEYWKYVLKEYCKVFNFSRRYFMPKLTMEQTLLFKVVVIHEPRGSERVTVLI